MSSKALPDHQRDSNAPDASENGFIFASLAFDTRAYRFHQAIDLLKVNFERTALFLAEDIRNAESALREYLASGDNLDDYEDGHLLIDHERNLEYDIEAAKECAVIFRKSILMPVYHQWERYVRAIAPEAKQRHADLVKALEEEMQYTPDANLAKLYFLVNILKHNNRKWVCCLFDEQNNFLPKWEKVPDKAWDWFDVVRLEDSDVIDLILAAKRSVPEAMYVKPKRTAPAFSSQTK